MVEEVKGIQAELHRDALSGLPVFVHGEVGGNEPQTLAIAAGCGIGLEGAEMVPDQSYRVGIDDLVAFYICRAATAFEGTLIADQSSLKKCCQISRSGRI